MKRDTKAAAERIGLKQKTFENWRCQGVGPPFYKISTRVIYDDADVDAWLASRKRHSTSEQAA